jgi:hypothetical protein
MDIVVKADEVFCGDEDVANHGLCHRAGISGVGIELIMKSDNSQMVVIWGWGVSVRVAIHHKDLTMIHRRTYPDAHKRYNY